MNSGSSSSRIMTVPGFAFVLCQKVSLSARSLSEASKIPTGAGCTSETSDKQALSRKLTPT